MAPRTPCSNEGVYSGSFLFTFLLFNKIMLVLFVAMKDLRCVDFSLFP